MADIVLDVTPRVDQWKDLQDFLKTMVKDSPASLGIAVYETIGTKTFDESQKKVPYDTGALKSTAYMTPPNKGNGYSTKVSYGKEKPKVPPSRGRDGVDYAQAVHERKVSHAHGEYLYLQNAAVEAVNAVSASDIAKLTLEIVEDRGRRNPSRLKPKSGSVMKG